LSTFLGIPAEAVALVESSSGVGEWEKAAEELSKRDKARLALSGIESGDRTPYCAVQTRSAVCHSRRDQLAQQQQQELSDYLGMDEDGSRVETHPILHNCCSAADFGPPRVRLVIRPDRRMKPTCTQSQSIESACFSPAKSLLVVHQSRAGLREARKREKRRLTTALEPEPAKHDAATANLAQSGPRVLVIPHVRASRVDQLPNESGELVAAGVFLPDGSVSLQ
jgi:hypothetical protein